MIYVFKTSVRSKIQAKKLKLHNYGADNPLMEMLQEHLHFVNPCLAVRSYGLLVLADSCTTKIKIPVICFFTGLRIRCFVCFWICVLKL